MKCLGKEETVRKENNGIHLKSGCLLTGQGKKGWAGGNYGGRVVGKGNRGPLGAGVWWEKGIQASGFALWENQYHEMPEKGKALRLENREDGFLLGSWALKAQLLCGSSPPDAGGKRGW